MKLIPQIRFKGFTDDWEECKLGDMMDVTSVKRIHQSDWTNSGIRFLRARDIVSAAKNEEPSDYLYISEEKYNEYSKISGKVSQGDLLVTGVGSIGVPLLITDDNPIYFKDGNIIWFKNEHKIDGNFFYYSFINNKIQKYIRDVAGIGTVGTYTIDSGKKTPISLPTYDEQIKIGTFFKQLDDTIALHQRKLDLVKETKKGFLQKMFPKNGEKVPEIRFPGFTEDWEERKLSDVANHRGGTAIEKYFDKDGVYKVISIGSYGLNSQYVDQNIRAISNEITDGRVVNSGELTMVLNDKTANGTIIGRTLLVEKDNEYVINQRTEIISPKENFDSNFAYTILNGPFREKVKRIVQGGTQIYVNYPAVSNLNLELPKIEEQQKIGSFFKQLDDTIALHQRKLDLLKETKKGFLQKMF